MWEAGVKSTKYHLKRITKDAKLTFEELSTLLAQIEACLNSRPLTPITSDPNDMTALTPGHFLIGDSLLAPPDHSNSIQPESALTRWQLVQRLYQNFWNQWQSEYLSRLQQRPKWTKISDNVKVGDLVLVNEANCPPAKWPLARIEQVHPGTDGLVRVVTLRCAESSIKRNITKISPLPL